MQRMSDAWTRPQPPNKTFPPYNLADQDIMARAEANTRKIARIYSKGHELAWNGPEVLQSLIDKHGGIRFPEEKKAAMGKVASVLLWGELAAWSISADIALKLDHCEAKMAASSQVFDEARHFATLRDYLWRAEIPIPKLGGYSRALLVTLLETDNLMYKLVGMQLLVENVAVCLFGMIAKAEIEPVLTELLYYFERDEARHVGLGVLTLPRLLADLNDVEAAKLWAFQLRIQLLMLAGGLTMHEAFATLGVDQKEMQMHGFRLQRDVYKRMRKEYGGKIRSRATRGLFGISKDGQARLNAFLFPEDGRDKAPAWHRFTLRAMATMAKRGDAWLARRAPVT